MQLENLPLKRQTLENVSLQRLILQNFSMPCMIKCCSNGRFTPIKCAILESAVLTADSLTAHFIAETSAPIHDYDSKSPFVMNRELPIHIVFLAISQGCVSSLNVYLSTRLCEKMNRISKIDASHFSPLNSVRPKQDFCRNTKTVRTPCKMPKYSRNRNFGRKRDFRP